MGPTTRLRAQRSAGASRDDKPAARAPREAPPQHGARKGARTRRWLAPEVVQTSSMDCGPAALKCLLEGHHVPVSYGRLREACQTDVDGTSIDTLEIVAQQLGLAAQQEMLPADFLLPHDGAGTGVALPALVVVRHADVATHFVVVWRRVGRWLQVMDPATGRRWVSVDRLRADLYRHEAVVPAEAWRAWAVSDEAVAQFTRAFAALGIDAGSARRRLDHVARNPGWRPLATLDAALRLAQALHAAGGVDKGAPAKRLLDALCQRTASLPAARFDAVIPASYWAVSPVEGDDAALRLRGAVLLRVAGLRGPSATTIAAGMGNAEDLPPLSPELVAALNERAPSALRTVWQALRLDGLAAPLALAAAIALATGAVLLETLLLRGLFEMPTLLHVPGQRVAAVGAVLALLALLAALEFPIVRETLRQGRHLETRLRVALLRKLPRLNDRYFQSRPISDMADRGHALHLMRNVPALGFQGVQTVFELALTLAAVLWLAPRSAPFALALCSVAIVVPWMAHPALRERDLRARNHHAALNGFYLDALLGLMPVRAHRAERNVATQHESLLVAWSAAVQGTQRIALVAQGVQALLGTAFAAALVADHLAHAGAIAGTDLLLVYWALKLPALGGRLAAVAQQYPAQRNVLMRLLEPLTAPDEHTSRAARVDLRRAAPDAAAGNQRGVVLRIRRASVIVSGQPVLREVSLDVRAGEHVAIVGASGAGKSSLLGVLLGWHRLATGELSVDGRRLAAADVDALRAVTAWVDPAVQLWNRSLLDNVTEAAAPGDVARLASVIEAARLRGVLARLPQGLQTLLGEGGALLSGGEGQRVRLARALLASDTRLVLLDEPFRGLDRDQRRVLLGEARRWWRDHTLLCVTHDVGETMRFDRVLVVHDGRIVEDGAPQALLTQPSRYRALLAAEAALRDRVWHGPQWRRLQVQDGRVVEQVTAARNDAQSAVAPVAAEGKR